MEGTVVNDIAPAIREIMQGMEPGLATAAGIILGLVFTFQLAWGGMENLLRQTHVQDFAAWVLKEIIVVSVFSGLIATGSELADWLIGFMEDAGSGGTSLAPSAIIGTGMELTNGIIKAASFWNAVPLYIVAIIILLAFATIAGLVILKMCEAAFVIGGGMLFLGFGGSRWTRDQAMGIIKYAFAVGGSLFVLRLLTGAGSALSNVWVEEFTNNADAMTFADCGVALAGAMILLMLVYKLPETVHSFMGGASMTGMSSFMQSANFLGAGLGIAASNIHGAIGTAGVAKNAYSLSSATREGAGLPTSGVAGLLGTTAAAAGNVIKGAAETAHNRASGRISSHASMFWQTSASLGDRARQQREDNKSPTP